MKDKKDIRTLTNEELEDFIKKNNLPKFRAKQIWDWLWKKHVQSFKEMSSLPKELRSLLEKKYWINKIKIHTAEKSFDNTIKYGFMLHDQHLIEGVLIPSKKRLTACISSQVGCSLSCKFCATGKLKLKRNLTESEIYDQVVVLNQEALAYFGKPITNIVFMGMGEPLLNYKSLLTSINYITTNKGLSMSPKRITVSTVGVAKIIKKLGDENVKFNLAISLHSTNDKKRSELMDINEKINLKELKESVNYFYDKTKSRVTYEYILLKNINDSLEDAKMLADFSSDIPCKINLIEYNPVDEINYEKSSNKTTELFINFLEKRKIIVNLRKSKGKDINAACGQLANRFN
tara:strand:- start:353 stop:1393 length:1041 start_codon:yes stop_codon:yes gene_type:complete